MNIRSLAEELGLSRTTVSDALRGKGRVSSETAELVQAAAARAGYRVNPLTACLMAEIGRRSRSGSGIQGTLAAIDVKEQGHWPHGPFPAALVEGARRRAADMGFSVELFVVGPDAIPLRRLDKILQTRGIHGVMVLPTWFQPVLSDLDWSRYAGIYTDYVTSKPALHSVCSDHYGNMLELLGRLSDRGYRRIGLVLEHNRGERIQHRQSAAFRAFQDAGRSGERVPVLVTPRKPARSEYLEWFESHRPDVVLSHYPELQRWTPKRQPADEVGFVLLNILDVPADTSCACLDLQPAVLGARAAELLVGQILRDERGIPEWPSRTTVEAKWIDGPTVRPQVVAGA